MVQKIYGPEGKTGSTFSELKNYLYQLILVALAAYDEKQQALDQLEQKVLRAKVLFKRGAYAESSKILQKVKPKVQEYEAWYLLLSISKLEQQISILNEQNIEWNLSNENLETLSVLENLNTLKNIYYRMVVSVRTDALLRKEEKVQKLKILVDHPVLQGKEWKSQKAEILFYWTWGLYAYSTLDFEAYVWNSRKAFDLSENRYLKIGDNPMYYLSTLFNYINSLGLNKQAEQIEALFPKFLVLKLNTKSLKIAYISRYYGVINSFLSERGLFEEALAFKKEQYSKIKKIPVGHFHLKVFHFQYFQIHFALNQFNKAQEYLNKCLALSLGIVRRDLQNLFPLLQLILHYELKNEQLLAPLSLSLYRRLKKNKDLLLVEKRILRFLDLALNARDQQEQKAAFHWLDTAFDELEKTPSETILFQYFDFPSWVKSKSSSKTFAALVKEKFQKKQSPSKGDSQNHVTKKS